MSKRVIAADLKKLAALTRHSPDTDALKSLSESDVRNMQALAARHRMTGLLSGSLLRSGLALSRELSFSLLKELGEQSALYKKQNAALLDIKRVLDENNTPFLLMKGHAVSRRFYQPEFERFSIDIDIFVSPENVDSAGISLESAGYIEKSYERDVPKRCHSLLRKLYKEKPFIHDETGIKIELHWRLLPSHHLLEWDFEKSLSLSETHEIEEQVFHILSKPAQLTYLLAHGVSSAWTRLKWFADIERMAAEMSHSEWNESLDLSAEAGLSDAVYSSLVMMQEIYGPSALHDKKLPKTSEKVSLTATLQRPIQITKTQSSFGIGNLGSLADIFNIEMGIKQKARYRLGVIMRYLVNYKAIETLKLGEKWLPLYIVLNPFLAIGRSLLRSLSSITQR